MRFNTFSRRGIATLSVAVAMGGAVMPVTVFADGDIQASGTEPLTNGVQEPGAEIYTGDADRKGSWSSADDEPSTDGNVLLLCSTEGGQWTDSQGVKHDNGTYVVRIPKAIKYEKMNAGAVSTSDDYDVTVEGVIGPDSGVLLVAETGKKVTGANLRGDITETTSLTDGTAGGKKGEYFMPQSAEQIDEANYHAFSADQCSVMDAGRVKGTTVQDNISMTGTALSAGTYTAQVQYRAVLHTSRPPLPDPGGGRVVEVH